MHAFATAIPSTQAICGQDNAIHQTEAEPSFVRSAQSCAQFCTSPSLPHICILNSARPIFYQLLVLCWWKSTLHAFIRLQRATRLQHALISAFLTVLFFFILVVCWYSTRGRKTSYLSLPRPHVCSCLRERGITRKKSAKYHYLLNLSGWAIFGVPTG